MDLPLEKLSKIPGTSLTISLPNVYKGNLDILSNRLAKTLNICNLASHLE